MKTKCSYCGDVLNVPATAAGRFVKCGHCGKSFCAREYEPPAGEAPLRDAPEATPPTEKRPPVRSAPKAPRGPAGTTVTMEVAKEIQSIRKMDFIPGIDLFDMTLDPFGCLLKLVLLPVLTLIAIPLMIAKSVVVGNYETQARTLLGQGRAEEARATVRKCRWAVAKWTLLLLAIEIGAIVAVWPAVDRMIDKKISEKKAEAVQKASEKAEKLKSDVRDRLEKAKTDVHGKIYKAAAVESDSPGTVRSIGGETRKALAGGSVLVVRNLTDGDVGCKATLHNPDIGTDPSYSFTLRAGKSQELGVAQFNHRFLKNPPCTITVEIPATGESYTFRP